VVTMDDWVALSPVVGLLLILLVIEYILRRRGK